MMGELELLAAVTLPGVKRSVGYGRRLLVDILGEDHPALDDIRTCVSEALTNSVVHSDSRNGGKVTLALSGDDAQIHVEVTDDGTADGTGPHLHDDPTGVHGRGMHIIDVLALAWDVRNDTGRTTLWMRFPGPAPLPRW